jgi:hypothetical protein
MESSPSGLSSSNPTQNREYLNSSVLLAFSAADLALEHDLSDIRNLDNTEKSTTLGASRRAGDTDGDGDGDGDDCNSMDEELEYLASSQAQESIREELSEAEDCWRQSLSSLVDFGRNESEIERDGAPNDDSEKPLDEDNEREFIGCDKADQIQPEIVLKGAKIGPEQVLISSFKGRVRFRTESDDQTLSTEEDSLQCINSMGSDTTDRSSGTEIAETGETRRPEPLTIDTQIPSRDSTTTKAPESPMGAILSSALLHKGHAGISLALASDILASQIYSQQSLLPYWLNKQLGGRCEIEKLSPNTKTHWLLGVPLIGSASKDGQVWLMGDNSGPDTPTSWVEDESLDDIETL